MALSPLQRKIAQHGLAAIAVCCVIFVCVSVFMLLLAGGIQLDGDYPTGPGRLLFSSLALVRFKGIIQTPGVDHNDYQANLLWFLNAFSWEWPTTEWEHSTGIVNSIMGLLPGPALTLPTDLGEMAARMRLPEEDWQCLSKYSAHGGICHNDFLRAWKDENMLPTSFSTAFALFLYYFVWVVLLAILLQEVAIRWIPVMVKCYCPNFISKNGLCPCLKPDEKMTPEIRTRMRTWYLALLAISYITASLFLTLKALSLVRFLKDVDSRIGGMDPQLGTGPVKLSALTLIAILFSLLCLRVRQHLEQNRSWMEQQGLDATTLEESGVESQGEGTSDASLI